MPNIKKIKINNIVYDIKVETDEELSTSSINPVQNKAVTEALDNKVSTSDVITNDEIDEICSGTMTTFLNSISATGVSF